MIEVNEALTQKVADLARLELSVDEVKLFTPQLAEILKYVELLGQVDVGSTEPMTHPLIDLPTPLRDDEVRPSGMDEKGMPKMLRPAPEVVDGGFKVPPIL